MKIHQVVFVLISAHRVAPVAQQLIFMKPFLFDCEAIVSIERLSPC
jgi:hypothetical protein